MRTFSIRVDSASREYAGVTITGQVDLETSEQIQSVVDSILRSGLKRLVFDVSAVDFIASTGIGYFVGLLEELEGSGGKIIFVGMTHAVKRPFEVLEFAEYFTMVDTMEEALEILQTHH